jgi:hypothetical protein
MALPPGPWTRAVIYSQNEDREWQNVFWLKTSGTPSGSFDINAFSSAVLAHFSPSMAAPLQTGFASVLGARVYYNNGTYTLSAANYTSTGGSEVSSELPTECSVIVRHQTNTGGPSGRGRSFISGVCSANVTASKLNSTGQPLYDAIATAMNASFTNQGLTLNFAILSKKTNTIIQTTSNIVEPTLGHRSKRRPIF